MHQHAFQSYTKGRGLPLDIKKHCYESDPCLAFVDDRLRHDDGCRSHLSGQATNTDVLRPCRDVGSHFQDLGRWDSLVKTRVMCSIGNWQRLVGNRSPQNGGE